MCQELALATDLYMVSTKFEPILVFLVLMRHLSTITNFTRPYTTTSPEKTTSSPQERG